jgi:hypothetical protein
MPFWDDVGGYKGPKPTTEVADPTGPGSTVGGSTTGGYGDYWRNFYRQGYNSPGAALVQFQTGNQDQARTQQQQVIQDLQRLAAGDRNSAAQQQLSNAYGSARSQQSSLGSTMRGQNAGAAMRSVQAGQQGINRGLAGDQQMLQLQEQQAAQAMLAQMLAQQHGQDNTQANYMAQGALGSQGLSDAMRQFYLGGGVGMDLAATERQNQIGRAEAGFNDANSALTNQLVNAGVNAAATGLATYGTFGSKPEGTK